MNHLAPEGNVYQAGTLSGNPLAMAAGLAMLQTLDAEPDLYTRLAQKTERLEVGFKSVLEKKAIPYQINRLGSMISLHFTDQPVIDFETAAHGDNTQFNSYFHGMLNEGIYLPPSAFESYFLNDALSNEDIDKTVESFSSVINKF